MLSVRQFLPILAALLVLLLFTRTSQQAWLDQHVYDIVGRYYPAAPAGSDQVVLISIDADSINQFGGWPLDRALHASAIRTLTTYGAASITYNLAFAERGAASADSKLLQSVQASGRVVLPLIVEQGRERLPLGLMQLAGASYAHADLPLDSDGVLRRHFLWAGVAYPRWPSLPVATLQLYPQKLMSHYPGLRTPYLHIGFSGRWSRDYELLMPLGLTRRSEELVRFSLKQLLGGEIDPGMIRGKAVFVGVSDARIEAPVRVAGQGAYFSTRIQALMFDALQQGHYLSPTLPLWSELLGAMVTCSLGFLLLLKLPAGLIWVCRSLVVMGLLLPLGLLLQGYWLSMLPTFAGMLAVLLTVTLSGRWKKQKSPE